MKEEEFYSLLHHIKQQCRMGIHTCNPCTGKGCNETTIGTGLCKSCSEIQLSEVVGEKLAQKFISSHIELSKMHLGLAEINRDMNRARESNDS